MRLLGHFRHCQTVRTCYALKMDHCHVSTDSEFLEVLAQLLEYLDQQTLQTLGYASKFLYAFSVSDDLWKTLFLE